MRKVNVQEAKTNLSRLLREVEAGEEIAIARSGRVIAHLVRVDEGRKRKWGMFEGQVWCAPDAFDPLSEDELADWEGGDINP
jgi:prevent-host-death family protein